MHAELIYPVLLLAGLAAGFIDSIAGGGGLITLPTLLAVGLPPHLALGTNKLQSSFGTATSTWRYRKRGMVSLRQSIPGIIFTAIGAGSGAFLAQVVSGDFLGKALPFLLVGILIYFLLTRKQQVSVGSARWRTLPFYLLFGLSLGFYDGFFGPGTGSFWPVALMALLGLDLVRATATTKVMNFTSNICALITFLIGGQVVFTYGLTMAAGQLIGARLGSDMAVRKGVGFIRPIFVLVVLATCAKVFYDSYFAG